MYARMPGEKEDQIGIKLPVKVVLRNQPPLHLMKREVMPAEREFPEGAGFGKEIIDMAPDRPPAWILPGMNQGYIHNPVPPASGSRIVANMVNPISLYIYYCYYGRGKGSFRF